MLNQTHFDLLKERMQGMRITAELQNNVTVVITVFASIYSVVLLSDGKYVNDWYSMKLLNIKKRLNILEEQYGTPCVVIVKHDKAIADAAKKAVEKD